MRKRLQLFIGVALLLVLPTLGFAQATLTSTTLSAAVTSTSTQTITVASATGFTVGNIAYIDREALRVSSVSGTTIGVIRGMLGTRAQTHATGAFIYIGTPNSYIDYDLGGSCTAINYAVLPFVNVNNGKSWNCVAGLWQMISDGEVFIPATTAGCLATPTTQTIASPQLYVRAALNNTVYSVTTNAAAGSFEVDCDLSQALATRTTTTKGIAITAINVLYGMQNVVPTSIANAIFGTITYPAVGGASSGTVTQPLATTVTVGISHSTPVATTSGQCYNEGNVLTTPLQFTALIPRLTYSQVFSQTAASATVVQICGFQVLFTNAPI